MTICRGACSLHSVGTADRHRSHPLSPLFSNTHTHTLLLCLTTFPMAPSQEVIPILKENLELSCTAEILAQIKRIIMDLLIEQEETSEVSECHE